VLGVKKNSTDQLIEIHYEIGEKLPFSRCGAGRWKYCFAGRRSPRSQKAVLQIWIQLIAVL